MTSAGRPVGSDKLAETQRPCFLSACQEGPVQPIVRTNTLVSLPRPINSQVSRILLTRTFVWSTVCTLGKRAQLAVVKYNSAETWWNSSVPGERGTRRRVSFADSLRVHIVLNGEQGYICLQIGPNPKKWSEPRPMCRQQA